MGSVLRYPERISADRRVFVVHRFSVLPMHRNIIMDLRLLDGELLLCDERNVTSGIGNWIRFMERLFEGSRIARAREFDGCRERVPLCNVESIVCTLHKLSRSN